MQSEEADSLASLFAAPRSAIVVFKRRRTVGTPDSPVSAKPVELGELAAAPRAPKVFRTPSALQPGEPPAPEAPIEAIGTAGAAPSSRRRRSDVRAPRLISHIVIETSKPDPEQAERSRIVADLDVVIEHAALHASVRSALDEVQSTLEAAHEAKTFELPFDLP